MYVSDVYCHVLHIKKQCPNSLVQSKRIYKQGDKYNYFLYYSPNQLCHYDHLENMAVLAHRRRQSERQLS